jgi:hypothetical protein
MSEDQIVINVLTGLCMILMLVNSGHMWIHRKSIENYKELKGICDIKGMIIADQINTIACLQARDVIRECEEGDGG